MLVDKLFALYEGDARRKPATGYPTGSRLGSCTASLQMLRFPALTEPAPPQPRDLMRWDEGNRTEEWLAGLLVHAFPNVVGLRQEPVYMRIPLPESWMVEELRKQLNRKKSDLDGPRLWGEEYTTPFVPPSIRMDGDRVRLRLLPCGPKCAPLGEHGWGCRKKIGFVLDPACGLGPSVWVPSYIDFALRHATEGLAIIEAKSMSNFAFRRALLGELDYQKKMQLTGLVEATGLPVVLVAYRKETSHLVEIAYTPAAARVRVVVTKMNSQQDAFVVDKGQLTREATGEAAELPADVEWDRAEVWTPYDPAAVGQIHEHVRRVLFAKAGEWHRQYGPDFTCPTCDGTGMQSLAKASREPLKGGPKPCENCGGIAGKKGTSTYVEGRGRLDETELRYPCTYCLTVQHCWDAAGLRMEIEGAKPHWYVTREAFETSGITFTPPVEIRVTEEP